jgi:hypothetical protein
MHTGLEKIADMNPGVYTVKGLITQKFPGCKNVHPSPCCVYNISHCCFQEDTEQDKLAEQVESIENRVKHIEHMLKTLIKHSKVEFEAVDEQAEERYSW